MVRSNREFGVPFAGRILPADQWAKTALKRLPAEGSLDFAELFGRDAPRVLDIGCGNGRFLLASAVRRPEMDHIGIDPLPMVIRYATRRAKRARAEQLSFGCVRWRAISIAILCGCQPDRNTRLSSAAFSRRRRAA